MDVLESLKVERIKLIHREDELKQEKLSIMNKIDLQIEEIERDINEINGAISIVKSIVDKYENNEEVVCPSCLGSGELSKANIETGCTETIECITCGGTGYIKKRVMNNDCI